MATEDASPENPPASAGRAAHRAPELPRHLVHRPRLSRLLDETTTLPVTVVVAPPGTGKSTVLAAWADASDLSVRWLSFDDDSEPRGAISSLVTALASICPTVGDRFAPMLEGSGSLDDAVRSVLDDLAAARPEPQSTVVLVIDDVHFVDHDVDVVRALTQLVTHLPGWLRVVLTSRREPILHLDRLRGRGQIGEIRFPELRLTEPEAVEMLSYLAPSMSDDEVAVTVERAAGWAAYLQLAAQASRSASARSEHTPPRPEADLLVEEYVWHEILVDEEDDLIEALTEVSIAPKLNARLADHLLDASDGATVIARAQRRGLFVHRINDTNDKWFEMHPIVRDVLLAELNRKDPGHAHDQHVRLAKWDEETGDIEAAIEQWLRVGQPREALRLLALHNAELYDTGHEAAVARTLASIPAHVVASDPQATIELAWCHLLVDRRRFVELVERAGWWSALEPFDKRVAARLTILQSIAATMQGDYAAGGSLARDALDRFGPSWWGDPLGRFGWNMVAREIALDERWNDAGEEVHTVDLALGGDPERRLAFEGTRALGEALAGHPLDALRNAAGVRRAAEVSNMTILRAELGLAEALALREIGDRQRAMRQLEEIASSPAETMLFCRVIAAVEVVHAHLDRGDRAAARAACLRAQQLIDEETFAPDGGELLARAGVRLAIADGDADRARTRAASITDPFWRAVSLTRVDLALGDARAALRSLEPAQPRCARHRVVHALLRSRAADTLEDSGRWASIAVGVAMVTGLLQTIAGEGLETIEHLERSAPAPPEEWLDRLRRSASDGGARVPTIRFNQVEPLTDREWDVLRFLPSRLTVREIAAELYVSVNTLKSHMKSVYRKLGVASRQEAAGVARSMLAARRQDEAGTLDGSAKR